MLSNPYPEKIFPDRDTKAALEAIRAAGLSTDAVFGSWGRQVWANATAAQDKATREEIAEWLEGKVESYRLICSSSYRVKAGILAMVAAELRKEA